MIRHSPPHLQHDTLMRYLLDKLAYYESDHSDALTPVSREANLSLAGEAALAHSATSEDLQAAIASMQKMQAETIQKVQAGMATSAAEMHQQLGDMSNRIESLARMRDSPSTVMDLAPCTACGQVAGRSFLHIPLPSCPNVCHPTLIAFFSAPNPPSSTPPTHQSTCCHAPNWFSAVNMDKDSQRTL